MLRHPTSRMIRRASGLYVPEGLSFANPLGRFGVCPGGCCDTSQTCDCGEYQGDGALFSDDFATTKSGWATGEPSAWSTSGGQLLLNSVQSSGLSGWFYYRTVCIPSLTGRTMSVSASVGEPTNLTGTPYPFSSPIVGIGITLGPIAFYKKYNGDIGGTTWTYSGYCSYVINNAETQIAWDDPSGTMQITVTYDGSAYDIELLAGGDSYNVNDVYPTFQLTPPCASVGLSMKLYYYGTVWLTDGDVVFDDYEYQSSYGS